jgi:hypothetical protein
VHQFAQDRIFQLELDAVDHCLEGDMDIEEARVLHSDNITETGGSSAATDLSDFVDLSLHHARTQPDTENPEYGPPARLFAMYKNIQEVVTLFTCGIVTGSPG